MPDYQKLVSAQNKLTDLQQQLDQSKAESQKQLENTKKEFEQRITDEKQRLAQTLQNQQSSLEKEAQLKLDRQKLEQEKQLEQKYETKFDQLKEEVNALKLANEKLKSDSEIKLTKLEFQHANDINEQAQQHRDLIDKLKDKIAQFERTRGQNIKIRGEELER